jgi:hypothetical protein
LILWRNWPWICAGRGIMPPTKCGGNGNGDFIGDNNMKNSIEYTIVAVPFHADAATHEELARKVNEKLGGGYELYGAPFFSEEMMYQAMTKPILQPPSLPST